MLRLRPLVFLVVLLATAGHAPAQSPSRVRSNSAEPRTDLNALSGSSSSLHHVRQSGSYYLSANIKCGAGMSAITIEPGASSVVIDFNGFLIQGTPGGSANGIDCPAAVTPRASLSLLAPRIILFGGHGISVSSVEDLDLRGALVAECGGDGASTFTVRRGSVSASNFRQCQTGVRAGNVGSLQLSDISVSSCDIGIQACVSALHLEGASVQGCSTDGIVLDDSCAPPGVVSPPMAAQLDQVIVLDCGNDGVVPRFQGAITVQLRVANLMVENCGGHGLHVPLVPLSTSPPTLMLADSSLNGCGGSGVYSEGLASSSGTIHHHYAHVDCSRNAQNGITMAGGSSLEGESLHVGFNGGNGIEVRSPPVKHGALRLSGVQCSGNGLDGCYLEGSTPIIRGTALLQDFHFVGNGRDGWSLTNFDATATHGTIEGNTRDGVHAVDGDLSTTGLGIGGNGNDGMNLLKIKHKGWDGMIYGTHRSGVRATDSHVHAQGYLVDGCVEDGVHVEGSTYEQYGGSLTGCGFNGLSATDSTVSLEEASVSGNGQDGLHLVDSDTSCFRVRVTDSGGNGFDAFAQPAGPGKSLVVSQSESSGNSGQGARTTGAVVPKFLDYMSKRNVAGGLLCTSGGTCSPVQVHVSGCTFDENGGVALDLQNAGGGLVERITILGSAIGIHVGDPAGLGCSSGVRISDCTVGRCTTGYSIDPGGGHLVMRNFASQCSGATFAVGVGNLCGPIVATQGEMLTTTNPNANFAQ